MLRPTLHRTSRPDSAILGAGLRRVKRTRGRRHARKLVFEPLERRVVLAAISWDGEAGNGNWGDANNWSTNKLPSPDDDVTIDVEGDISVSLTTTESIKTLTCNETLIISGGSLYGVGEVAVNQRLEWITGKIAGTGDVVIERRGVCIAGRVQAVGLPSDSGWSEAGDQ